MRIPVNIPGNGFGFKHKRKYKYYNMEIRAVNICNRHTKGVNRNNSSRDLYHRKKRIDIEDLSDHREYFIMLKAVKVPSRVGSQTTTYDI